MHFHEPYLDLSYLPKESQLIWKRLKLSLIGHCLQGKVFMGRSHSTDFLFEISALLWLQLHSAWNLVHLFRPRQQARQLRKSRLNWLVMHPMWGLEQFLSKKDTPWLTLIRNSETQWSKEILHIWYCVLWSGANSLTLAVLS